MAESEDELKSLLMKVKEEACLKLNIQKTKILASGPNTSWQIGGETIETGEKKKERETLFSWAPKSLRMVTAAMKLKTPFGRKAMTNLGSMLKSRDIILLTKVCINQSYGFFSSHIWM